MAKVFISLYNFCKIPDDYTAMPPFFEAFIEGMKDAGNDVLVFQTKEIRNRGFETQIPEDVKNSLLNFDPDVCIIFNNNFFDITSLVDCPILIYDVDSPLEYQIKDNIKENIDRYKFIYNQTKGYDEIMSILEPLNHSAAIFLFSQEYRQKKLK